MNCEEALRLTAEKSEFAPQLNGARSRQIADKREMSVLRTVGGWWLILAAEGRRLITKRAAKLGRHTVVNPNKGAGCAARVWQGLFVGLDRRRREWSKGHGL